jgi:hypothetical protein
LIENLNPTYADKLYHFGFWIGDFGLYEPYLLAVSVHHLQCSPFKLVLRPNDIDDRSIANAVVTLDIAIITQVRTRGLSLLLLPAFETS